MSTPFRVLGVSGSMSDRSRSTAALNVALDAARHYGAETQLLDLREVDLPIYRPDLKVKPPAVTTALESVRWANGFILASPDYHGGMSGALKNFLDYHWKEFTGKLFGYVCSSNDKGLTAMDQMRTAVRQGYGWSLPYGANVLDREDFDAQCNVTNDALRQRLRLIGRDITVYGTLLAEQYRTDLAAGEKETFARGQ